MSRYSAIYELIPLSNISLINLWACERFEALIVILWFVKVRSNNLQAGVVYGLTPDHITRPNCFNKVRPGVYCTAEKRPGFCELENQLFETNENNNLAIRL